MVGSATGIALAALAMAAGAPVVAVNGAKGTDSASRVEAALRLSTMTTKRLIEHRGYTVIGKIHMNGAGIYEVWAIDPRGRKVKLYVHPSDASILRKVYSE